VELHRPLVDVQVRRDLLVQPPKASRANLPQRAVVAPRGTRRSDGAFGLAKRGVHCRSGGRTAYSFACA
jgi:hypothetical protein